MRENLFKGKRKEDGEWVKGDLIHSGEKVYIHPVGNFVKVEGRLGKIIIMFEVDPDTLCRYTGKTDANDKDIWENDIVEFEGEYGAAEWWDDDAAFVVVFDGWFDNLDEFQEDEIEVIGNKFDNSESLEMKK